MDEEIDSPEPMTTIFYEVKPITETISPYGRTVKPVSRDQSSKVVNRTDDNTVLRCDCGKLYRTEASLRFHKYECGKIPSFQVKIKNIYLIMLYTSEIMFQCPFCTYVGKRNTTLRKHIKARHDNRIENL